MVLIACATSFRDMDASHLHPENIKQLFLLMFLLLAVLAFNGLKETITFSVWSLSLLADVTGCQNICNVAGEYFKLKRILVQR